MEMNRNNFLRWEGQFAGAKFWTLSYSLLKNATCTIPATTDYYTAQPQSLDIGSNLFEDEACNFAAINGWYSDGIFNYQVNDGIIVSKFNCEG